MRLWVSVAFEKTEKRKQFGEQKNVIDVADNRAVRWAWKKKRA